MPDTHDSLMYDLIKDNTWESMHREDLHMIPSMIENGWEPKFSETDKRHNRTTPQLCPHDPVSFKKGSFTAGIIYSKGYSWWKLWKLVDGHYVPVKIYVSLYLLMKNH